MKNILFLLVFIPLVSFGQIGSFGQNTEKSYKKGLSFEKSYKKGDNSEKLYKKGLRKYEQKDIKGACECWVEASSFWPKNSNWSIRSIFSLVELCDTTMYAKAPLFKLEQFVFQSSTNINYKRLSSCISLVNKIIALPVSQTFFQLSSYSTFKIPPGTETLTGLCNFRVFDA